MQEKEFKDKVADILGLYFDKDDIDDDVLNHFTTLAEKYARDKCETYKNNISSFLFDEWEIDKEKLKESVKHGINKAPLPEFNWLIKKY